MDKKLLVYTTWPSAESAEAAARAVVQEKLAACANVLPAGHSYFVWDGKFETATETVALFKTSAKIESRLQERLRALHPYECPCILSLEVSGGFPPFLEWIDSSTS